MQLSIRMQAVADMVTPGRRIADIGTDHGYVQSILLNRIKQICDCNGCAKGAIGQGLVRILSDSGAATE